MAAKRPFAGTQKQINFIDLTSDTEDDRPAKRHRSLSNAPAPVIANEPNSPLFFPLPQPQHSVIKNTGRSLDTTRSKTVLADDSSSTALRRNGGTLPSRASLPANNAKNSSQGSADSSPKPKSLANGMTNLSLRPSPRPRDRPYGRQPLSGQLKDSRSATVVDLVTDSDNPAPEIRVRRKGLESPASSESPARQDEPINLEDWIQPEAKPLRFDPEKHAPMSSGHISLGPSPERQSSSSSFKAGPRRTNSSTDAAATPRQTKTRAPANVEPVLKPVQVIVPPTPAQKEAKRKVIMRKLKSDVTYIKTNPDEVAAATGVAPFNNANLDNEISQKARQKKFRKINRQSVQLDLGDTPPSSTKSEIVSPVDMIHPRKQARRILTERFKQPQPDSLTFENRRNERNLNGKFQFVSNYVLSRKVLLRKPTPLPPRICHCEDGPCETNCPCSIAREVVDGKIVQSGINHPAYERVSSNLVVLSREFLDSWSEKLRVLFECTSHCNCSMTCNNRVVQKGRTIPLQIFETAHCGFGVRTLSNLVRGQFIDVYLGEVLTTAEVEKREETVEEDTPAYLLSLDVFIADTNSGFHIDGANFGSVTRFVNHSCEPNSKTIPVVLSDGTKHLYHVAFFAIKDIAAGTEITIDYNPDLENDEDDEITDSAIVQCRCGSANCRKRLWKPGKEKRGRKRVLPLKDD